MASSSASAQLLVLLLAASACVAVSAQSRALLQDGLFNCGGVKQLGTTGSNMCCQLCSCIGSESDKKMLAADSIQKICKTECAKCVGQAYDSKACPKDSSPLPSACSSGLQFTPAVTSLVNKCLALYKKDPSAAKKVAGC